MAGQNSERRFSLKDHLFNETKVRFLAGCFEAADARFEGDAFVSDVMSRMAPLELKQRVAMIADVLEHYLPEHFEEAAARILPALPPPLDPNKTDDDFGDFILAPLGEFVVRHGLSEQHYETSIRLLKELTQRFSMEGPIRPFIEQFPERTLAVLDEWASDPNYHVRRLVSEGTRPRLPWAGRIDLPMEAPLPLLDRLHADSTRYVTRSVANHMNDIAKADPELALSRLKRWQAMAEQDPKELDWVVRHSLRYLVKQGHPEAMGLLGFSPEPQIRLESFEVSPAVARIGGAVQIETRFTALRDERLMVDYIIEFVRKRGSSAKVFKLKQIALDEGESATLTKRHNLKADASTFTLSPGRHELLLQVNGKILASATFDLVAAEST